MGSLSSITLGSSKASKTARQAVDALTFVEAPWGLNMKLHPVQRVILKVYYGIALDDNPLGYPLDVPVPTNHAHYDPQMVDSDGYYKYRVVLWTWRREITGVVSEKEYLEKLHKEGRCNIGAVVPGKERRELILAVGRRSGKCVTGDTLVNTDRGLVPIRDLGDPNGPEFQPLDVTVVQEGGKKASSAFFYNGGVQPTYRFRTQSGYGLEGTASHRIRVMTEQGTIDWRRLEDLRVGDQVAIHRNGHVWPTEYVDVTRFKVKPDRRNEAPQFSFVEEKVGLLLGYMVGDGTWTDKQMIRITVGREETRQELVSLMTDLFGRCSTHKDNRSEVTSNVYVCGKKLRDLFECLGYTRKVESHTKKTPWVIMQSPMTVVRAYLQGLFETDGTVSKDGRSVSFCSASEQLVRETQQLLLCFGITSTCTTKHNKKYGRDYYNLFVTGSKKEFQEKVGFRSHFKQSRIETSAEVDTLQGSIPHQKAVLTSLIGKIDSNTRITFGNILKNSGEEFTYPRLKRVLPLVNEDAQKHLTALLDAGYFYDPVESVEQGQAPVFDLNVPDGSMFAANGFMNHNTELSSCIAAYETYRLLVKGDPQTYYGLPSSENIQLVSFATDKDQAGILYQKVSGYFRSCAFFAPYTANNTQTYAKFQTPKDIERYGSYQEDPNAKATIRVTFRSSVAKGARGPGNIVVVFDEMAHFTDNGQSSAEEVYNAVVPSTATFTPKDPKNKHKALSDNLESKILAISSPLGCQGMFYKLYQDGFRKELLDQRLCIQAPTWEVNTSIPAQIFQSEFIKDPRVFFTEFGAQFSDRTSGWLEDARDLMACVDPDARPLQKAAPLKPHFMGLDLALAGDASACVIGHVDELGRVVVDVAEAIQAGHGKFINQPRLEYSEVVNWIHELTKRFYIQAGAFDQWAGVIWGQLFKEKGLDRLEQVNSSALIRSQMYKNLKDVIYDKKLVLFDYPIEQGENHCQLITQLLELQAEYKSEYNIVVRAPKIAGKHDDLADALARMVQLATEQTGNKKTFATPYIAGSPRYVGGAALRNAAPSISTHRKRLQTGSSPERMVPKRKGGICGR